MINDNIGFADCLGIISLYLGLRNLTENEQQSAQSLKLLKQNDVQSANDKQAAYLLKELYIKFDEQNQLLKEILEAVKND